MWRYKAHKTGLLEGFFDVGYDVEAHLAVLNNQKWPNCENLHAQAPSVVQEHARDLDQEEIVSD